MFSLRFVLRVDDVLRVHGADCGLMLRTEAIFSAWCKVSVVNLGQSFFRMFFAKITLTPIRALRSADVAQTCTVLDSAIRYLGSE